MWDQEENSTAVHYTLYHQGSGGWKPLTSYSIFSLLGIDLKSVTKTIFLQLQMTPIHSMMHNVKSNVQCPILPIIIMYNMTLPISPRVFRHNISDISLS